MLPHKHFLVAGLVITPAALLLLPVRTLSGVVAWVVAGGLASALVDTDIIALVALKARRVAVLGPFRNPLNIFRRFGDFMDAIFEAGVLRTAMKNHFLISIAIVLGVYLYGNALFVPVLLGVLSHLATDVPNYKRVFVG